MSNDASATTFWNGHESGQEGLRLYRALYWANQRLLHAVRALQDAECPQSAGLASSDLSGLSDLNAKLRQTQAMIEETRSVMNRHLAESIEHDE